MKYAPGTWCDAQVNAWKTITSAIHSRGCKIYCQLWHQGRAGNQDVLRESGSELYSSSAVAKGAGCPTPIPMTEDDINQVIRDYATAAKNAIAAGFDGVEIHAANGYLPDQFLQDTCNHRTDSWGGSIQKRCKFVIELTKAVIDAVGCDKTGLRLSPYSDYNGMLMTDPEPSFEYLIEQLKPMKLAYLHLIEARIRGNDDADCGGQKTVQWMVEQWDNTTPVLLNGGFNAESAKRAVDLTYKEYNVMIVFGRYFVSNPDLVFRIKTGVPLEKYVRTYFYTPGLERGYVDYVFCKEFH